MTDPRDRQRSLEADVCRDLGRRVDGAVDLVSQAALGLATPERFATVNSGRIGRENLLSLLAWSRQVLDDELQAPATWRGPSRSALATRRRENSAWLAPAFADVTATDTNIGVGDLLRWNTIVGAPGEWRTRSMSVDGYPVQSSPEESRELTERLVSQANEQAEPAPVAAARLHFGLLLCHPFRDGNGRTARLAAAAVLLRDGTKNSLQTCVEQHHHLVPARYPELLGQLRQGSLRSDQVIDGFLGAMAGRCVLAAWVRRRQQTLLRTAWSLGHENPLTAVRCFEFGDCATPLSTHGNQPIEPWHRIRPHLNVRIAQELRSQLARSVGDA